MTALEPLLIDTDILIDYLRGWSPAITYIEALHNPLFVSAITVAELYVGVREGAERTQLDTFLLAFTTVVADHDIAVLGGLFRRHYGKSHGMGLADALIAATAQYHRLTLVTRNVKHFPMLTALLTPY